MLELVIGGAASGKSEYAEKRALLLGESPIYLATMTATDEESQKQIFLHRKRREHTGFVTVECAVDISQIRVNNGHCGVILLECLSNLAANEMFGKEGGLDLYFDYAKKISEDIFLLYEKIEHMIIVTNNIFEDGNLYDESTACYIRTLARLNSILAGAADKVTEVVCGISL